MKKTKCCEVTKGKLLNTKLTWPFSPHVVYQPPKLKQLTNNPSFSTTITNKMQSIFVKEGYENALELDILFWRCDIVVSWNFEAIFFTAGSSPSRAISGGEERDMSSRKLGQRCRRFWWASPQNTSQLSKHSKAHSAVACPKVAKGIPAARLSATQSSRKDACTTRYRKLFVEWCGLWLYLRFILTSNMMTNPSRSANRCQ